MSFILKDNFVGVLENTDAPQYGDIDYDAQTFTAETSYSLVRIEVYLRRSNNPGEYVLSVRSTNPDGTPFGNPPPDLSYDLSNKTINTSSLVGIDYAPIAFDFDPPVNIVEGFKYAIVGWAKDAPDNSNKIEQLGEVYASHHEPGNYAGGRQYGINWDTHFGGIDLYFKCYALGNTDPIVEGPIMNVDENNLSPTPESANPTPASGQLLNSETDAEVTVEPGVYVLTPVSGYVTLGYGIQNTDANIIWSASTGAPGVHICVPVGVTTLHYKCVGTGSKACLRRVYE